jgi:hypothetical protein
VVANHKLKLELSTDSRRDQALMLLMSMTLYQICQNPNYKCLIDKLSQRKMKQRVLIMHTLRQINKRNKILGKPR